MSFFNPQFQILSDIHLEKPLIRPSYQTFRLDLHTSYLCLLGDIGLVKDDGLLDFLEDLLKKTPNLTIFYLFGNHEYYQLSTAMAQSRMIHFAERMSRSYGNRFILLNRTRHDVSPKITVLGCTLWSHIKADQMLDVSQLLTDFNPTTGIRDWDPAKHMEEHQRDLNWLNSQIKDIETNEPHRQVIVLTHHSPTMDSRANDPRHAGSTVKSGFVTDLSQERCWNSKQVKLWCFGHTHYSFSYREEVTDKLVVANQNKHFRSGETKSYSKTVLVEAREPLWEIVDIEEKEVKRMEADEDSTTKEAIPAKGNRLSNLLPRWFKIAR